MPSQMTRGGPPQGLVTLKFLNRILEQTALGLHVKRPTARPYLPEVVPEKFSKVMLVMFTRDGYRAHAVASICSAYVSLSLAATTLGVSHIEVAGVYKGRVLVVAVPKVLECDVIDESISSIGASPRLETGGMLAVEHPHILNVHVADEAQLAGILPNRPHGLPVSPVAVHSVDVQVCGIRLGRETVVSNVDPSPFNPNVLDVE
jgi:hypothetical protein